MIESHVDLAGLQNLEHGQNGDRRMKKTEQEHWDKNNRQFHYTDGTEVISLIYPAYYTMFKFEIYQIRGNRNLFEDVERFDTLEEAETRIKELLTKEGHENEPT